MRRFVVILALLTGVLAGWSAAQQGFSLSGRLGATEQESQEGYFAIGDQTMIVVKPGSELHAYLRSRVGQQMRVTVEPDVESE